MMRAEEKLCHIPGNLGDIPGYHRDQNASGLLEVMQGHGDVCSFHFPPEFICKGLALESPFKTNSLRNYAQVFIHTDNSERLAPGLTTHLLGINSVIIFIRLW